MRASVGFAMGNVLSVMSNENEKCYYSLNTVLKLLSQLGETRECELNTAGCCSSVMNSELWSGFICNFAKKVESYSNSSFSTHRLIKQPLNRLSKQLLNS